MSRTATIAAIILVCCLYRSSARAETTDFFSPCQTATLVTSGVTFDTVSSRGYLFTYTRDKLFTGGTGHIIGRSVRVPWPDGVEAQAVTTPPPGVTDYKARIAIQRIDGAVFDLPSFTFKLLASTAGAGAAVEIMPLVNGEDAFNDPLYFEASGFYGQTFSYDTSPNPWGSTALLTGYDTYKVALYVDFAFIALSFDSAVPGDEACCLPNLTCYDLPTGDCSAQGGLSQGTGTTCLCTTCPIPPGIPVASGWGLAAMVLFLLGAGKAVIHKRRDIVNWRCMG